MLSQSNSVVLVRPAGAGRGAVDRLSPNGGAALHRTPQRPRPRFS